MSYSHINTFVFLQHIFYTFRFFLFETVFFDISLYNLMFHLRFRLRQMPLLTDMCSNSISGFHDIYFRICFNL